MRRISSVVATCAAAFMLASPVLADDKPWPPAQMTIVMPHDVGSSHNVQTRALAEVWAEKLGTKFIYENKAGASGRVGYDFFVNQPKDGSVILSSNLASSSIMYVQQKPKWNYEETIYPAATFGVDPGAIFVRKDSPFTTFKDLIEEAKKRKVTMGISYWASPENLQIHQVMAETGAQFEIIPHTNSGEIITQVLGGHLQVGYSKVGTAKRAGDDTLIIAVPMATNPIKNMTDDAPTVDEVIGTRTMPIASYRGILVHKEWADANPEHLKKLIETMDEALKDARVVKAMEQTGVDPSLLINLNHDEIMDQIIRPHWDAFQKHGSIYSK